MWKLGRKKQTAAARQSSLSQALHDFLVPYITYTYTVCNFTARQNELLNLCSFKVYCLNYIAVSKHVLCCKILFSLCVL